MMETGNSGLSVLEFTRGYFRDTWRNGNLRFETGAVGRRMTLASLLMKHSLPSLGPWGGVQQWRKGVGRSGEEAGERKGGREGGGQIKDTVAEATGED